MSSAADNELMLKVRNGDLGKLSFLFERYHSALFNFFVRSTGNRELSEDLVQEVFLRLLKYRHTFRAESQFSTWMYHVARNAQIDHFRKHRHEGEAGHDGEEEFLDEIASSGLTPEQRLAKRQESRLVRRALVQLNPEKREVLILSRYQGLKYEEIAAILGCEVGTVKGRVCRAVRELADVFHGIAGEKAS